MNEINNDFFIKEIYENQKNKIVLSYKKNPLNVIIHELIMIKVSITNSGKIEIVPVLDDIGDITTRDNVENITKESGKRYKNRNFGNPLKYRIKT